jgi:hypothetical protein
VSNRRAACTAERREANETHLFQLVDVQRGPVWNDGELGQSSAMTDTGADVELMPER